MSENNVNVQDFPIFDTNVTDREESRCQLCYKILVGLIMFPRTAKYSKIHGRQSVFLKDAYTFILLGTEIVFIPMTIIYS